MSQIELSETKANEIKELLSSSGYLAKNRDMCVRYFKGQGDSIFIHHSLNIIRANKNTVGQTLIFKLLGAPNGKAPPSQEESYNTWFLNGYTGKSGSRL